MWEELKTIDARLSRSVKGLSMLAVKNLQILSVTKEVIVIGLIPLNENN